MSGTSTKLSKQFSCHFYGSRKFWERIFGQKKRDLELIIVKRRKIKSTDYFVKKIEIVHLLP